MCPAGKSCSNSNNPTDCTDGTYSTHGMMTCEQVRDVCGVAFEFTDNRFNRRLFIEYL